MIGTWNLPDTHQIPPPYEMVQEIIYYNGVQVAIFEAEGELFLGIVADETMKGATLVDERWIFAPVFRDEIMQLLRGEMRSIEPFERGYIRVADYRPALQGYFREWHIPYNEMDACNLPCPTATLEPFASEEMLGNIENL